MNCSQRNKLLGPIRLSLHGWAFVPKEWLPGMIKRAEALKQDLPAELHAEAARMIEPLKKEFDS